MTEQTFRGRAFGVDVHAPFAFSCLAPGATNGGERFARFDAVDADLIDRAWKPGTALQIGDFRDEHGRRTLSIEHHQEVGFRIWAPRYGRHLVSHDGQHVRSALPQGPDWRWQRLVFSQVLPLSATLQGLELLHASGVATGDGAVAFVAASGTGKTSVATHLVARGATLITDDVLALEQTPQGVLAHPGAKLTSLHPSEYRDLSADGRVRVGTVIGRSAKLLLSAETVRNPLPLRSFYFLRRDEALPTLEINRLEAPDPRELLASAFLLYVATPQRLENLLATCAALARTVAIAEIRIPRGIAAQEVARAVEDDLAHRS